MHTFAGDFDRYMYIYTYILPIPDTTYDAIVCLHEHLQGRFRKFKGQVTNTRTH